jgi:uncharacterized repeat protein (TIGR04076 family)
MTDFALSDALGVMLPLARRLLFLQGVPMMELVIDVARVEGMCNAGLSTGQRFCMSGTGLASDDGQELCRVALASISLNVGRLGSGKGPLYVSCPDPGTGSGGNVVFRLRSMGAEDDDQDEADCAAMPPPVEIRVVPVHIIGTCPAGLTLGAELLVEGMKVTSPHADGLCVAALSHLPMGIWQLQSGSRFFAHSSCPGCTRRLQDETRVVFLLGHADKWELCCAISEYLRLIKRVGEPHEAQRLKAEAIACQTRGDFEEAAVQMRAAIEWLVCDS